MIKRISGILIITLFAICALFPPVVSNAQDDGRFYVAETGHWITNDFLATYQSVSDPQTIFGFPITDAYINQTTNRVVQYFQRALFELHPENPPELRVEIKRLGEYLYQKGEVLSIPQNFPACQYFPDTRHQVCYAFLDYFKAHGGIAQFGYPISEIQIQEGRIVQWFQRACFEWHPELPSGNRVTLSELGQRYFDIRREDHLRLKSDSETIQTQTILRLQARAFPEIAVVPQQAKQSIYVILQDQNLRPVSNVTAILTIKYPSGNEATLVSMTDVNGVANIPVPVNEQVRGIVEVSVKVSLNSLEQTTRTSFRIWW